MKNQRITEVFENNQPNTPMTEKESMIFLKLLMTEEKEFSVNINELDKNGETYKRFDKVKLLV